MTSRWIALLGMGSLALAGCEGTKIELVRTADSGFTLTQSSEVPVYRTECDTEMRYGPDPSCGYHEHCHPCADPDHHSEHGSHCTTEMRSCYHPETVCYRVLDRMVMATVRVNFDPRARLLPGQSEKVELTVSGSGEEKTADLRIRGARYRYDFPSRSSAFCGRDRVELDIPVRLDGSREDRPPNNLELVSGGYSDPATFVAEVGDPWLQVGDIRDSVYRIQVKRGLKTYLEAEVRRSDLLKDHDEHGGLRVVVRKGDAGWRHDPKVGAGRSYTVEIAVRRDAAQFGDRFSQELEAKIRY